MDEISIDIDGIGFTEVIGDEANDVFKLGFVLEARVLD